jgi:hypothetical protein
MLIKALHDIDQRGLKMKVGEEQEVGQEYCDLVGHGMAKVLRHDKPGADAPVCVAGPGGGAAARALAGKKAGSDGIKRDGTNSSDDATDSGGDPAEG